MKQVFVKFAPHLINLIKLFAVRRNRKFKINKIWMNAVAVLWVRSKNSYYKKAQLNLSGFSLIIFNSF